MNSHYVIIDSQAHYWEHISLEKQILKSQYQELAVMRFVCISDTHNRHGRFNWETDFPKGDFLIHCGDFSDYGLLHEVFGFNRFLGTLRDRYRHIVVVPGNHEFFCDYMPLLLWNVDHFLLDRAVTVDGVRLYGSRFKPFWPPTIFGRPENAKRNWDDMLQAHEKESIDICITHEPPNFEEYDEILFGYSSIYGMRRAIETVNPHVHMFGHYHQAGGMWKSGRQLGHPTVTTTFVNAASLEAGPPRCPSLGLRRPIVFDFVVDPERKKPSQSSESESGQGR